MFVCIFFYLLLFTHLGVEFTDTGFHIQCSYEIWNYHVCHSFLCFLTYIAGGLWQALSPVGKSLQWLYIGGCVLWGFTGVFIFLTIRTVFNLSDRILAVCVIGAFLSIPFFQFDLLIHYYNFPLLLSMVYCFVFVRLVCGLGNKMIHAGLLGLLSVLMIASRFPLILFGGIPLFYFMLRGIIKKEWTANGKMILFFFPGVHPGDSIHGIAFSEF